MCRLDYGEDERIDSMNITVYLGANEGNNPSLKRAVKELGTWIGKSGNALIYGGSKSGLMGALADSVLNAGGNVTGVEPQFFIENEFQHEGITKLIATKDMSERKNKMIELGNAFIAFPGGTGTLEEITEIMSKVSLKQLNAPCIVYNLNGYYDSLKAMLKHMIDMAHSVDVKMCIEGIETQEELDKILEMGCDYIQGYYFSKPLPFNEIEEYLKKKRKHYLQNILYFLLYQRALNTIISESVFKIQ